MEQDERLTKVYVDLPNHWATGGESMWARALGDDLYELRNVPFHAYGLNHLDIVRAIEGRPELKPGILEVVRRSGHQTLRVFFRAVPDRARAVDLLDSLRPLHVSWEGMNGSWFALDLEPEADVNRVRDELDEWERAGWIEYETCEGRAPGSFDVGPKEGDVA